MTFQASIRKYKDTDCEAVSKLFYETVHYINARDYTDAQLYAWAKDERRLLSRRSDLLRQYTLLPRAAERSSASEVSTARIVSTCYTFTETFNVEG